MNSGDLIQATKKATSFLEIFDRDRDFAASIQITEKIGEIADAIGDPLLKEKAKNHKNLRLLLQGKTEEVNLVQSADSSIIMSDLVNQLISYSKENMSKEFVIQNIEKQNIFGVFKSLSHIPTISLADPDDVVRIVDKYYDEGRYLFNLINKSNQLQQAVNVDLGRVEEVNVVEKEHIFKIQS